LERIALIGKPNSGKSSLFNILTGLNQKVANYSGATVEKKTGNYKGYELIDLPGIKSLKTTSPEEKISKDALLKCLETNTPLLFVVNGMQIEDNLMLFTEIADMQIPSIFVINFKDDLASNKINIDTEKLSNQLACPVVLMNARTGEGLKELDQLIADYKFSAPNAICRSLYDKITDEGVENNYIKNLIKSDGNAVVLYRDEYEKRQKVVNSIIRNTIQRGESLNFLSKTKTWDKVLLHPIYGIVIFLFTMYLVFQSVFALSAYPMDWIDQGMASLSQLVSNGLPQGWFNDLISDAIIQGIGGVIIFIPQIAILFFLLGLLEHSGYLSRISYITDNFLRKFGLSGKSVIPLMSSWACAIPAIMSARMIDDPRERMSVIMAAPLMTCAARLPVYTILIAILVPTDGGGFFGAQGLILLCLYLIGVVATLVVAYITSKRSKIEANNFWSLELPVYRVPNWRNIFINVYQKTKSFVLEAGKVILAISILLWVLASNSPKSEQFIQSQYEQEIQANTVGENISMDSYQLEYSYLGYIGKFIEPAIKPLGYDWKIGIGLLSSFAAREVFVGTMSTIYSIGSEEEDSIIERLRKEVNLETGGKRYNLATTLSLLLFYVFALQCMSTVAITRKETGSWKMALWQFFFMTALAYIFALIAFQGLS